MVTPLLLGVPLGDFDRRPGRVGADDRGAEPRQRLAQDTAAAADVEKAQAREAVEPLGIAVECGGHLVADIADAGRIELVQCLGLAVRIPPFGERRESCDLGLIDGGRMDGPLRHAQLLQLFCPAAALRASNPAGMYTRLFAPELNVSLVRPLVPPI